MSNKRPPKSTAKTKKMASNNAWFKNVAKSIGYSSSEMLSEIMPATMEFATSGFEAATDIYQDLRENKMTGKRVIGALNIEDQLDIGLGAFKNAVSDIKSGNIYNKERMEAIYDEDDDFGMEDFDFDSGSDDEFEDGDEPKVENNVLIKNTKNISDDEGIVTAIGRQTEMMTITTDATIQSSKQVFANTLMMDQKHHSIVVGGINSINDNIGLLVNFQSENMGKYIQASLKYYEDNLSTMSDTLSEIKKITAPEERNERKELKNQWDDTLLTYGGLNIKGYADTVSKNFKLAVEEDLMLSSIKTFIEDTDTLKYMAASPLSGIAKLMTKKLIPEMVQQTIGKFDESLQAFFPALLLKITSLGENNDGNYFYDLISKVFGVRATIKNSIDTDQYQKGKIPFDGVTKKAITEVIPTYLRKIYAVLSNKEEVGYDYDKGQFRSMNSMKTDMKNEADAKARSGYSDGISRLKEMSGAYEITDTKEREEFLKGIDTFFTTLGKSGKFINPYELSNKSNGRDMLKEVYSFGDDSKDRLFRNMILQLSNAEQMDMFGGATTRSRVALSKYYDEQEKNIDLSYMTQLNNGLGFDEHIERNSKNPSDYKTKKGATFNALDKFNLSSLDYLRRIEGVLVHGIRVFPAQELTGNKKRSTQSLATKLPFDDRQSKELTKYEESEYKKNSKPDREVTEEMKQKMLEQGKVSVDTYGDIGEDGDIKATLEAYNAIQKEKSVINDNQKDSLFKKMTGKAPEGMRSSLSRISEKINNFLDAPGKLLDGVIQKLDNAMFKLVFDIKDEGQSNSFFGTALTKLTDKLNSIFDYFKEKVIDPIHEMFFGEDGLVTKFKNSQFFDSMKAKMKSAQEYLFGIKNAEGNRQGGMFSDTGAYMSDMFSGMKYYFTGKSYKDSKGVSFPDNKESVFGHVRKTASSMMGSIKTHILGPDYDKPAVNGKKKSLLSGFGDAFREGATSFHHALFGDGNSKRDQHAEVISDLTDKLKKGLPKALSWGLIGGAVGLTMTGGMGLLGSMFLPGGPIGASILGLSMGLLTQSDKFMDKIFGSKDDDGKRIGGIITANTQKIFKDNKNSLIAGAALGALKPVLGIGWLPSMFFGGGPVGGAIMGMATSLAIKSKTMQRMLFGEKDNPNINGLFGSFKKAMSDENGRFKGKQLFGNVAVGAVGAAALNGIVGQMGILGAMLTPMGPMGAAMMGAASGFALTSDKWKEKVFGKIDKDSGQREGGALGIMGNYMKVNVFEPLKNEFSDVALTIKDWAWNKMIFPIAEAAVPLKVEFNYLKDKIGEFFTNMTEKVGDVFHKLIANPISQAMINMTKTITKSITNSIAGLYKFTLKAALGIISAPIKLLTFATRGLRNKQYKRGTKEYKEEQKEKLKNGDINRIEYWKDKWNGEGKHAAGLKAQGGEAATAELDKLQQDKANKHNEIAKQRAELERRKERTDFMKDIGLRTGYNGFVYEKDEDGKTISKASTNKAFDLFKTSKSKLTDEQKEMLTRMKDEGTLKFDALSMFTDTGLNMTAMKKSEKKNLAKALESGKLNELIQTMNPKKKDEGATIATDALNGTVVPKIEITNDLLLDIRNELKNLNPWEDDKMKEMFKSLGFDHDDVDDHKKMAKIFPNEMQEGLLNAQELFDGNERVEGIRGKDFNDYANYVMAGLQGPTIDNANKTVGPTIKNAFSPLGPIIPDSSEFMKNVQESLKTRLDIKHDFTKPISEDNPVTSEEDVTANLEHRGQSHADGLEKVPKDNYLANLHEGEAVVTKKEAEKLRNEDAKPTKAVENSKDNAKAPNEMLQALRTFDEEDDKEEAGKALQAKIDLENEEKQKNASRKTAKFMLAEKMKERATNFFFKNGEYQSNMLTKIHEKMGLVADATKWTWGKKGIISALLLGILPLILAWLQGQKDTPPDRMDKDGNTITNYDIKEAATIGAMKGLGKLSRYVLDSPAMQKIAKKLGQSWTDWAKTLSKGLDTSAGKISQAMLKEGDELSHLMLGIGKEGVEHVIPKIAGGASKEGVQYILPKLAGGADNVGKKVGQKLLGGADNVGKKAFSSGLSESITNGAKVIDVSWTPVGADDIINIRSRGIDKFMVTLRSALSDFVSMISKGLGKLGNIPMNISSVVDDVFKLVDKQTLALKFGQLIGDGGSLALKTMAKVFADPVFMTYGAISGLAEAERLFGVYRDDVDIGMRVISSALKAALNYKLMFLIDILNEIIADVTDVDIFQMLAIMIYKIFADNEGDVALDLARQNFSDGIDIYNKENGTSLDKDSYNDLVNKPWITRLLDGRTALNGDVVANSAMVTGKVAKSLAKGYANGGMDGVRNVIGKGANKVDDVLEKTAAGRLVKKGAIYGAKTAKSFSGAVIEVGKAGGAILDSVAETRVGKFKEMATQAFNNIGEMVAEKFPKSSKAASGIIKQCSQFLTESVLKQFAPKISKKIAGMAAGAATGGIWTAIEMGVGAVSGWNNAGHLFGVAEDDVDYIMKGISAIIRAILNASWFFVVDIVNDISTELTGIDFVQMLAEWIYDLVASDEKVAEFKAAQVEMGEEVTKYNMDNGTSLTSEEYLKTVKDPTWWTKQKNKRLDRKEENKLKREAEKVGMTLEDYKAYKKKRLRTDEEVAADLGVVKKNMDSLNEYQTEQLGADVNANISGLREIINATMGGLNIATFEELAPTLPYSESQLQSIRSVIETTMYGIDDETRTKMEPILGVSGEALDGVYGTMYATMVGLNSQTLDSMLPIMDVSEEKLNNIKWVVEETLNGMDLATIESYKEMGQITEEQYGSIKAIMDATLYGMNEETLKSIAPILGISEENLSAVEILINETMKGLNDKTDEHLAGIEIADPLKIAGDNIQKTLDTVEEESGNWFTRMRKSISEWIEDSWIGKIRENNKNREKNPPSKNLPEAPPSAANGAGIDKPEPRDRNSPPPSNAHLNQMPTVVMPEKVQQPPVAGPPKPPTVRNFNEGATTNPNPTQAGKGGEELPTPPEGVKPPSEMPGANTGSLNGEKSTIQKMGDNIKNFPAYVQEKMKNVNVVDKSETAPPKMKDGGKGVEPDTIHDFSYFAQTDDRYANHSYDHSPGQGNASDPSLRSRGCGPTSMAMVASQLTGKKYLPTRMADMARAWGHSVDAGTTWSFFPKAAKEFSMDMSNKGPSVTGIRSSLESGRPVIISGQRTRYGREDSPFTPGGHFVVAVKNKGNSQVLINDPRGSAESKAYDINKVVNEAASTWDFKYNGGPTPESDGTFKPGNSGSNSNGNKPEEEMEDEDLSIWGGLSKMVELFGIVQNNALTGKSDKLTFGKKPKPGEPGSTNDSTSEFIPANVEDAILKKTLELTIKEETGGNYTRVKNDMNGSTGAPISPSIGVIQMRGGNAKTIMTKMAEKLPGNSEAAYWRDWDWNNQAPWGTAQMQRLENYLTSNKTITKQVQDSLAMNHIKEKNLSQVYKYGVNPGKISDPRSIVYAGEIANTGPALISDFMDVYSKGPSGSAEFNHFVKEFRQKSYWGRNSHIYNNRLQRSQDALQNWQPSQMIGGKGEEIFNQLFGGKGETDIPSIDLNEMTRQIMGDVSQTENIIGSMLGGKGPEKSTEDIYGKRNNDQLQYNEMDAMVETMFNDIKKNPKPPTTGGKGIDAIIGEENSIAVDNMFTDGGHSEDITFKPDLSTIESCGTTKGCSDFGGKGEEPAPIESDSRTKNLQETTNSIAKSIDKSTEAITKAEANSPKLLKEITNQPVLKDHNCGPTVTEELLRDAINVLKEISGHGAASVAASTVLAGKELNIAITNNIEVEKDPQTGNVVAINNNNIEYGNPMFNTSTTDATSAKYSSAKAIASGRRN